MKPLRSFTAALLLSCLPFSPAAAMTEAEQEQLNALFENASDASAGVAVGSATITAEGAAMLQGADACTFDRLLNAEEVCTTDAVVFPPEGSVIASIYYAPPQEIGYVDMEEWTDDASSRIDEIWQSYVEGSKEQSARLGYEVTPVKWVLYPTLDRRAKVMTYGILLNFGGEQVINLQTIKFTRKGYVEMTVVTYEDMLTASPSGFTDVASYAADTYAPHSGFRYADFEDGDKIAAVGALGVLASVMGVQSANKGTLAAIGAALLVFFKKLWFLLLALPLALWGVVKKLAGRNKTEA